MKTCENCEKPIEDLDASLHDGDQWFCNYRCRGQWIRKNVGEYLDA